MGQLRIIFAFIVILHLTLISGLEDPDLLKHCGDAKALALGLSSASIGGKTTGYHYTAPAIIQTYAAAPKVQTYSAPAITHYTSSYEAASQNDLHLSPPVQVSYEAPLIAKVAPQNYAVTAGLSSYSGKSSFSGHLGGFNNLIQGYPTYKAVTVPKIQEIKYSAPIVTSSLHKSASYSSLGKYGKGGTSYLEYSGPIVKTVSPVYLKGYSSSSNSLGYDKHYSYASPNLKLISSSLSSIPSKLGSKSSSSYSNSNLGKTSNHISVNLLGNAGSHLQSYGSGHGYTSQLSSGSNLHTYGGAHGYSSHLSSGGGKATSYSVSNLKVDKSANAGYHQGGSSGGADVGGHGYIHLLTGGKKVIVKEDGYYNAHPKYSFEYSVHDPHTGDMKEQKEERDGDVVKGQYSLVEPDGNVRTVTYQADWETGFHAQVHNSKKP